MAKSSRRNIADYTSAGMLLDRLCIQNHISFRQLAAQSGMSVNSQMSIVRACRGLSVPRRENVLAWCETLQAKREQRALLLHAFHYATPEEARTVSALE